MELGKIETTEIKTEEPKLQNTMHLFVTIPLQINEKAFAIQIMKCSFKIFKNENRFSLAINLDQSPPQIKKKLQEIEKQIRKLAMENKEAVLKLNSKFGKFTSTDFNLIKTDRSEMAKVWGKLWTDRRGNMSVPFSKFGEGEVGQRKSIRFDPHDHIGEKLTGHVVFHISRIFCGSCRSITCSINCCFVTEFHGSVSAFDGFEDVNEED